MGNELAADRFSVDSLSFDDPGSMKPVQTEPLSTYSLAGSWNDWSAFHELVREEGADGVSFRAEFPVPTGQHVEFQIFRESDWNQRLFPAYNGRVIAGPSSIGHDANWRLDAPTFPSRL